MYHPPPAPGATNNTRDEFIELRNVSSQPIALGSTNASVGSWRIAGGVNFQLPTNFIIAPDAYALVVGFDPLASSAELASFLAQYQLVSNTVILGPWSGQLQNGGEKVRLLKPNSAPLADDDLTSHPEDVLVDEVDYSNSAPWPASANGVGASLQRISGAAYANDPINWLAALPTPARLNAAPEADADGDGLPDGWETAEGLDARDSTGDNGPNADPDGDGFTNLQEYQSGTAPRSAASRLQIESLTWAGAGLQLRFTAAAGRSYSVLVRPDIHSGSWTKRMDIPAAPTASVLALDLGYPDGDDFPRQFYRIVTPAQP
jgi:hypothetical protein